MKRIFLLLLLCASPVFATTTVTGTIQNLGTQTVGAGTFVRFWLRGCAGNQPRVNGTALIAPTNGGVFYFDMVANASGQVSGTLYSTRDAAGTGNGEIECGGSLTAVWYGMQAFVNGKGGPEVPIAAKIGATIDISNVTPLTTNPVVASPTGDTTYARLDGGNTPFTGGISVPSLNNIQYVDCVHYSCSPDIGVGINAAIAALPSGGTVVLPSTGTYSMGTGVTIPGGVWVKGNLGAKIQPASNIGLFTIQPDARISGVWVDTANLTANTLSSSIFTLTGGTYKDGQQTIVEDNKVTAENQLTAGGAAILLSTSAGGSGPIAFTSIRHNRIDGMAIGILLKTTGSEWINGNHFEDNEVSSAPDGYVWNAGGSVGIGGNIFTDNSFEAGTITINVPANIGVIMEGSGPILYNSFEGSIWDSTTPIENITSPNSASGNLFQGRFDGTISDSAGTNTYLNTLGGPMSFDYTLNGVQFIANRGAPCTNGELALSAGWGTSPTVTAVAGTGQTCEWTITSGTGTPTANPTITDTLTNALPSASTVCTMTMEGGTGSFTPISQTTLSATVPAFTFNGTPVATDTYIVNRRCGP